MQELENMSEIAIGATVAPILHVDALPVGTRLAEFEIQGLLGVGGFGMVYRAYDHSLQRTVAIKEYMPSALAGRQDRLTVSIRSSVDETTYASGLKSFVSEARLLAQFDHPSLVKVYRFWEANNTAYMVMPLYSGMTLKQARSLMVAPPSEAWLRTVLWSILQALQVLHRNKTLHRDVSPDNIFLQDMGPPVLLDLGAARRAISDKSHKVTAILKVNFAPIEQYVEADDLHQGPWTDLYALGAVAYTCLRNDPPMPATARVVRDRLPPLSGVVKTVQDHFGQTYSDEFVRTITHAMAIQPGQRPQSVQEFVDEMKLQAAEALARFDWRTSLGGPLLPAQADSSDAHLRTQPQTIPSAIPSDTQVTEWPPTDFSDTILDVSATPTVAASKSSKSSRLSKKRRRRRTGWLAVALILVAGLVFWLLNDPEPFYEASMETPAESPAQAVPVAPAAAAVEPVAPATPQPPVVIVQQPVVIPEPVRVVAPPPKVSLAPPSRKKERVAAASASPEPAPPPVYKPEPERTAAPSTPANAEKTEKVLCASSNFFSRPMCIHLECKKTENTRLAVCIEDRKRYPEDNGTRRP
jgi:serine/threonine protein kinase